MKAALLLLATATVCLAAAQVAAADASFTDPAGDSQTAPDILAVTVANDAAGNLTFTVRTNQAALNGDALVLLELDTDKNSTTGSEGLEYVFLIGSQGWQLLRWDGTRLVAASASSANASYASNTATFKISRADLGGVGSFNFYADSVQVDAGANVIASDTAPDGTAVYTYTIVNPPPPPPPPAPLTLRAGAVKFSPAKAVAGRPLAIRVGVTRGDTGGPLASGAAACKITVAGKPVRASGAVRAGVASCSLRVPATARGKQLRGTVKVTFRGVSTTKAFSIRIS